MLFRLEPAKTIFKLKDVIWESFNDIEEIYNIR